MISYYIASKCRRYRYLAYWLLQIVSFGCCCVLNYTQTWVASLLCEDSYLSCELWPYINKQFSDFTTFFRTLVNFLCKVRLCEILYFYGMDSLGCPSVAARLPHRQRSSNHNKWGLDLVSYWGLDLQYYCTRYWESQVLLVSAGKV